MASVMNRIYMVCLIVGAAFGVLSFVLNGVLDGIDFDFDFELGGLPLPIKPFTVMVFITVFGGAGLIAARYIAPLPALPIAAAAGAGGSVLMYQCVYKRLKSMETHTPFEYDALMTRAQVVESIPPGGYGKISYVIDGNTLSGTAVERMPGHGIKRGASVYIVDIEGNVCYVSEDLRIEP